METSFGSFADYSGTFGPLGVPTASATVQFSGTVSLGSTINISNVITILIPPSPDGVPTTITQNVAVQVSSVSSTSFTFTTLPGHVLYPATISFSAATGSNGQLSFGINVSGNFSSPLSATLYYAGGYNLEDNIWNNVLANVKKDCAK